MKRFFELRRKLFKEIERQLAEDPYCKSYEGTFEITQCFPNYFDDEQGGETANYWVIELYCYVVGPHRHYRWDGDTLKAALDKAEEDILFWIGGNDDGR